MAAEFLPGGIDIAARAAVAHRRRQHSLLHADQPAYQLEYRAGRVAGLYRPVEERLAGVGHQLVVVAAHVRENIDIDARTGNEREDFTGRRLDRDKRALAALHQFLAVLLEMGVDGSVDVAAGDSELIVFALVVGGQDAVARVAKVDMIALLAPKVFLPGGFQARAANVVAALVFGVFPDVVYVNFRDIAEQVSAGIEGIHALGADLATETGEAIFDLAEAHICVFADMFQKHKRFKSDTSSICPVIIHLFPYDIGVYLQHSCQPQGVESRHLARGH